MANLEVIVHCAIRPGQLEGFKAQAAEILRLVRETDTQVVRYDWFINEQGTESEIHEEYRSEQGVLEHGQHIMQARQRLFSEFASDHRMCLFGEVSPQLKELFRSRGMDVGIYAFFGGLQVAAPV